MGNKSIALLLATTSAVFFVFGALIGVYVIEENKNGFVTLNIKPLLIDEISAEKISANLKHLTSVPHVAGTEQDLLQAEWVRDRFLESGLDEAHTVPYDVLLSYPRHGVVNTVQLIDEKNQANFTTAGRQPPLGTPQDSYDKVLMNFNAYSGNGIVEGNIVYAYYGRDVDYEELQKRGVNVTGHVVLVRYGAIFRGSKVVIAAKWGAIGVILFTDPKDKAKEGRNFTFPDSWWLPGMGVESGSLYVVDGDPLTPAYPAIESAFRLKEEEQANLPRIPVQPIGYDEAEILLRSMSCENPAPPEWVGLLATNYCLGPKPLNPDWKVRINVSTTNEMRRTYNTIGILRGSVEEDRYVLLGNHRDAWTFGALDPSSGTASMIEVVRALGHIKKNNNWRPRRTMVFCSWGAEEFGLIGSYEWTQQFAKVLSQRAVAYLNVDVAVGGNQTLRGSAYPMLKKLLIESSKLVPNPNAAEIAAGRKTVFDTWAKNSPDANNPGQPAVGNMGGGSDFAPFAYVVGAPTTDFGYTAPSSYPTYHTLYDNYQLASEIVDRGFVHHQAVARMWAISAADLADATILPFDIKSYAAFLNDSLTALEDKYDEQLQQNNATFKYFRASVDSFSKATNDFSEKTLDTINVEDPLEVRRVNDRLVQLERFFIDPKGLPDRPETNHIVFSVSANNAYGSDTFAGLVDLLFEVGNKTEAQDSVTWNKIRQHLSVIAFLIGEAARSLSDNLW